MTENRLEQASGTQTWSGTPPNTGWHLLATKTHQEAHYWDGTIWHDPGATTLMHPETARTFYRYLGRLDFVAAEEKTTR